MLDYGVSMLESWKHLTLLLCSILFVCLMAFRIWNFILLPRMRPGEVAQLPYWIPVIGNGFEFFNNFHKAFASGSRYVKDPNKIFTLYIAGRRLLVLQSPRLIDIVTNDTDHYDFNPFVEDLYKGLVEIPDHARQIIWKKPADGYHSLQPNPRDKTFTDIGMDLLHTQLLRSAPMNDLLRAGIEEMDILSKWGGFRGDGVLAESDQIKVVSLYQWCRGVMIKAEVHSFFGPFLNELDPTIPSIWDTWNINSWQLSYGYPKFLASVATKPRDRMIHLLQTYLKTPLHIRHGAAPFVRELEDEMKHIGLSLEDSAKVLVIILSSINSNVYLSTFWIMAYILQNPHLISELRKEILAELSQSNIPEHAPIKERINGDMLDRCNLLRSVFNETIRLCSTGCTVRKSTDVTVLDGKVIPKDTVVFMPVRPLLLSTSGFGPDARSMDPYRFLNRKLERSPYFRPFGSGITLCSGRTLGRQQTMAFAAIVLLRYDLSPVQDGNSRLGIKGKPFPQVDEGTPSLGIATPVRGNDMIVSVSQRSLNNAL